MITVFTKIMKCMIVDLCDEDAPSYDRRTMCDSAVQAFYHMHHMLLAVALRDHTVVQGAVRDVLAFVNGQTSKDKCPDLGVLLVKLLLVPADTVPWSVFARVFFRELLARQVRWIRGGAIFLQPEWDGGDDHMRIDMHFEGAKMSLGIITLQSRIANSSSRPKKMESATAELSAIKATMDDRNGMPSQATTDHFWASFEKIKQGERFSDYLNIFGVCPRPNPTHHATLARWLRQAVVDSQTAGYHRPGRNGWPTFVTQYANFGDSEMEVFKGYD
eukprot:jgi/Tetstr1/461426/TSEL_006536.t1